MICRLPAYTLHWPACPFSFAHFSAGRGSTGAPSPCPPCRLRRWQERRRELEGRSLSEMPVQGEWAAVPGPMLASYWRKTVPLTLQTSSQNLPIEFGSLCATPTRSRMAESPVKWRIVPPCRASILPPPRTGVALNVETACTRETC